MAEHQLVADFADDQVLEDLPKVPAAVGRIAVQAGPDQYVVLVTSFL
jgi:hypothetical protein